MKVKVEIEIETLDDLYKLWAKLAEIEAEKANKERENLK
jgi:hypothetical protein